MWKAVIERFERHAPASVMARLALEHALPEQQWVDEVFEAHRQHEGLAVSLAALYDKVRRSEPAVVFTGA